MINYDNKTVLTEIKVSSEESLKDIVIIRRDKKTNREVNTITLYVLTNYTDNQVKITSKTLPSRKCIIEEIKKDIAEADNLFRDKQI
jgi:hypothetical protein